jgi:hypothetical protein
MCYFCVISAVEKDRGSIFTAATTIWKPGLGNHVAFWHTLSLLSFSVIGERISQQAIAQLIGDPDLKI